MSSPAFRPPAVPLVAHTPYFSVWSFDDRLTDGRTRHWTGAPQGMSGLFRVNGKAFRFCGPLPHDTPAMEQRSLIVTPTRSVYEFAAEGAVLTVEFLSPLLADDLDLLARPVTYVRFELSGAESAEVYLDVSGEWCVDRAHQPIMVGRHRIAGLETLSMRATGTQPLNKTGDDVRIDWGSLYVSAASESVLTTSIAHLDPTRGGFVATGELPETDDLNLPRPAHDQWPGIAVSLKVQPGKPTVLMLAYDEEYALEYFGRPLKPYWKRSGASVADLLTSASAEYEAIRDRCVKFDADLTAELEAKTTPKFAQVAALAYRQCLSAHGLAEDRDGSLLHFSKENFSNGCIVTVDVTYPGSPFFLKFNPELLKGQVAPILDYARSSSWRFPFAPHDLGTYPKANGQVYGGGERTEQDQMPVEECGNMLVLTAAYGKWAKTDALAKQYWDVLTGWADYLLEKGLDPENQLCTDDFAGHLAHNANLSLKAILGIAAYAQMAEKLGEDGAKYRAGAEAMAKQWAEMADDGDHYRLAFDKPGSWSQKYNLVWDDLLGLDLFPKEIAEKEVAWYLKQNTANGLPLDSRRDYTKLDWIVWTSLLADSPEDAAALLDPLYDWATTSPTRVPLTDWYHTEDGRQAGFQARSVVGGLFISLLK
ncbi:DUF4965 domain-containing protein [bacterium]|nr:MAG: DUF4965 domain-containing protein [bacterium]